MENIFTNKNKLGFGFMRLPLNNGSDQVNIDECNKMVDTFMQNGGSYFDTAYIYHGGKSEEILKQTLIGRYERSTFTIATKLAAWAGCKTKQEAEQMFYTSLERLGCSYIDFYLLHNLTKQTIKIFEKFELFDFVQNLKKQGLVKHIGFSMHDDADFLKEVLTKYPYLEFVQLQLNYLDWEDEEIQSRKIYEVANQFNKPIIVMEPVKGGSLANLADEIIQPFKKLDSTKSTASWALKYVASLENVCVVLSGMSNIQQMTDNLNTFNNFEKLNKTEIEAIEKVKQNILLSNKIGCTNCKYCLEVCPKNIPINNIFDCLNVAKVLNNKVGAKTQYSWLFDDEKTGKACDCIKCTRCEKACPQHIKIISHLESAADIFDK